MATDMHWTAMFECSNDASGSPTRGVPLQNSMQRAWPQTNYQGNQA